MGRADKFREKSTEELKAKLIELKNELRRLEMQRRTGRPENPGRIRIIKKDIARILTILRERGERLE